MCWTVLHLLKWSMVYGQLPDITAIFQIALRIMKTPHHYFNWTLESKVKQTPAVNDLALESVANDASVDEEPSISGREYLPMRIVDEGLSGK